MALIKSQWQEGARCINKSDLTKEMAYVMKNEKKFMERI